MRVTNDTTYRTLLRDLQRIAERLQEAQLQASSGKRINKPSDDPAATSDVVRIHAETSEIGQYLDNIASARTRLEIADTALNSMEQIVDRVRTLALLATSNISGAHNYATEIAGLRDQIVSTANTTSLGQFIFGGTAVNSPAYVKNPDGTVSYAGNDDFMRLQIARSTTLQTQIPGSEIFTGPNDIFATLQDLVDGMNAGDKDQVAAQVAKLEQTYEAVGTARGRVGGLLNVAQTTESELKQNELSRAAERMHLEDADLARVITELARTEAALQAATAVGARISNITILDYLR